MQFIKANQYNEEKIVTETFLTATLIWNFTSFKIINLFFSLDLISKNFKMFVKFLSDLLIISLHIKNKLFDKTFVVNLSMAFFGTIIVFKTEKVCF